MQIEKGQVLNPLGRGARKPITDAIRAVLSRNEDDPLNDKPKTKAHKIALELVRMAEFGDDKLPAIREIIDRVEGKPNISMEVTKTSAFDEITLEQLNEFRQLISAAVGGIAGNSRPCIIEAEARTLPAIQ